MTWDGKRDGRMGSNYEDGCKDDTDEWWESFFGDVQQDLWY